MRFIASKGSIAVDGISLTVNEVTDESFASILSLLPKRLRTSARALSRVNLEIDQVARYVRASWEG